MAKLDLTSLKGKQNDLSKATESPTGNGSVAPVGGDKPSAGLAFLKTRQQSAPVEVKAESPSVAPKAGGGLGFLKNRVAAGSGSGGVSADSKSDANGLESADRAGDPKPKHEPASASRVGGDDTLDLASLMDSESGGKPATLVERKPSRFDDEVPAQPPERVTPPEADKQMLQFVASLDSVYAIVHEPDLLGGVIKNLMIELGQKPEYRKLIAPKDVHTMIKGMRDSMGMARIKKEESKSKRAKPKGKAVAMDGIDDLLNSIGDFD